MPKGKQVAIENKLDIVMALLRKEASAAELARRHGIAEQSLYRWRDEFLEAGKQGLMPKKAAAVAHEIHQLRKELKEHKQLIGEYAFANDFLKKRLESSY